MEKPKLKVSDVIPLSEQTVLDITASLGRLAGISKEYYDASEDCDVLLLERLKRSLLGELQYVTTLYSKVRRFKGESFTYLSAERKATKAAAIKILMEGGMKITAAEVFVYDSEYYKERITLMNDLVQFFLKTEHLVEHYQNVIHSIIQSVSLAGKERAQSIHA
jgi:hypothetical protein